MKFLSYPVTKRRDWAEVVSGLVFSRRPLVEHSVLMARYVQMEGKLRLAPDLVSAGLLPAWAQHSAMAIEVFLRLLLQIPSLSAQFQRRFELRAEVSVRVVVASVLFEKLSQAFAWRMRQLSVTIE